jgi:hypothetical protein
MLVERLFNRFYPKGFWQNLIRKNKKILAQSSFILSFDCDTEEDYRVAYEVHLRLNDMGIMPVYAVPGELLIKGEKVYSKIYNSGAEFINHGGREHTYFDKGLNRYKSCFFYDEQDEATLAEDIELGHKILNDVLGVHAKGWRTPHFGTYQSPQNLKFIHSQLRKMNYVFSTSTTPVWGYRNGSVFKQDGIIEIPVSGVVDRPVNILDTWAYFEAPDKTMSGSDYVESCRNITSIASESPILINIYGDPSHIHCSDDFFASMKLIAERVKNTNYHSFLGSLNENIRSLS